MKISIIIIVNIIDEYLFNCIDNVSNQTLKEKEIIICICNYFSETEMSKLYNNVSGYNNIEILNNFDGNTNELKNTAIDMSKGKYIMFIDGSEILNCDSLNLYYKELDDNNLDILTFDFKKVNSDRVNSDKGSLFIKDKEEVVSRKYYIEKGIYTGQEFYKINVVKELCIDRLNLYIYKRSFIIENKILFDDRSNNDQVLFILKTLIYAKTIKYIDFIGSVDYANFSKNYSIFDTIYVVEKMIELFTSIYEDDIKQISFSYLNKYLFEKIIYFNNNNFGNKLNIFIKNIESKFKFVRENLEINNKVELDMLLYNQELYKIYHEKDKISADNYTSIIFLTRLLRLIEKDKKIDKNYVIDFMDNLSINKKYISYERLMYNLMNFKHEDEECLYRLTLSIRNFINDLEYDINPNIINYNYIEYNFLNLLYKL